MTMNEIVEITLCPACGRELCMCDNEFEVFGDENEFGETVGALRDSGLIAGKISDQDETGRGD